MKKEIIVLDCDGVLLNYNRAYPAAWEAAFGEKLVLKNPGMHHAFNEYDCPFKDDAQKAKFYEHFTGDLWATMPPLEDALAACNELVELGYELVCVTTMPSQFHEFRLKNLTLHNLPISRTFSLGRDKSRPAYNAKKELLLELKPVAFVDDYVANFFDLEDCGIHKALIYRNQSDSPNNDHLHLADSVHSNLQGFVDFWKACGFARHDDYQI